MASSQVRTVAVIGHASSGKTSLIDAALFAAGATPSRGRVASGNSAADHLPEEIDRKISIHAKPLFATWEGHSLVLVDTPGLADFSGATVAAATAADAAVLVVDGVAGVEVGTRRLWKLLERLQKPRLLFVSKLDKENSDFARTVEQIRSAFGNNCVPAVVPVGQQAALTEIVDVLAATAAPAEVSDAFAAAAEGLTEAAAEQDDALLEAYLGGEKLTPDQVRQGARAGTVAGKVIPIYGGSADKDLGVNELLNGIAGLLPSPIDRSPAPTADGGTADLKDDGPFSGLVWKVTVDPYAGHLAYVRVMSGVLKANSEVVNTTRGGKEKVTQLLRVQGKTQAPVDQAGPGEIVALPKLKDTHLNNTLAEAGANVQYAPITFPRPVASLAIHPQTTKDEEKISPAVHRLAEEDATFKAERNPNTKELVISGMGDVHLAVAVENMKRRYGVSVDTSTPKVDYKETITRRAEGHYKHKKQSGGHGQYGEAYVKIEPVERGKGFEFVNEVVGGSIPRNFIPAVEKGCAEAMGAGTIAGFSVVDVRAIVYDGSYHDVDSNELSFRIAGLHAFKEAMSKAHPVLLEPIMSLTITVPDQYMGDITGDLNHRRGRIMNVDAADGMQIIKATAPLAEIFKYSSEMRSMTAGRGTFELEPSHYEQVPASVTQKVVAEVQAAKQAEAGG